MTASNVVLFIRNEFHSVYFVSIEGPCVVFQHQRETKHVTAVDVQIRYRKLLTVHYTF